LKTEVDVRGKPHRSLGHGQELFQAEPTIRGYSNFYVKKISHCMLSEQLCSWEIG